MTSSSGETIAQIFAKPETVSAYARGPLDTIPGFSSLHRTIVQLFSETVPDSGARILVLGAGGGLELQAFSTAKPGWNFCAVDPSQPMLDAAKSLVGPEIASDRIDWITGVIDAAPVGQNFDAATCLLTLHVIKDKVATLEAIRARLKPGAPLVVVDNCIDMEAPDAKDHMRRYMRYRWESVPESEKFDIDQAIEKMGSLAHFISPEKELECFKQAGFSHNWLFFAGLYWRGWILK